MGRVMVMVRVRVKLMVRVPIWVRVMVVVMHWGKCGVYRFQLGSYVKVIVR